MKIDTHVLFLIVIVGIISVGLVGANVLSSDQSMKQEVFDGIKISVPSDSNFVKTGDGVYKDSKYGVTIHTFKNNDSMINYLKNTKNSKIVPVENQPPQSVAFKKGDTINILVTNGQEGVSVSSKDGGLTTQIANNIVFRAGMGFAIAGAMGEDEVATGSAIYQGFQGVKENMAKKEEKKKEKEKNKEEKEKADKEKEGDKAKDKKEEKKN